MSDIYPLELAFLDALPPLIFGVGLGYLIRAVQRLGDGAAVRLTTWGGRDGVHGRFSEGVLEAAHGPAGGECAGVE